MANFVNIPQAALETYSLELSTGGSFKLDLQSSPIPYDFKLNHRLFVKDEKLQFGFKRGNSTTYQYSGKAQVFCFVQTYFISDMAIDKQPKIVIRTQGHGLYSVRAVFFEDSKYFRDHIDILRNESPLFMQITCDIDNDLSTYLAPNSNNLLQHTRMYIRGGGKNIITSSEEPVGEGEEQLTVIEAFLKKAEEGPAQ